MSKNFLNNKTDNIIRAVIYGATVIILGTIWFYKPVMNNLNISKAENCYKAENYTCAFKNYYAAFSSGVDNSKYVTNYFNTLQKMKKVALVQGELTKLMELYPDNDVMFEIEQIFAEIRENLPQEYKNTYIDVVVQGNNVVHWNNINSKIKIFLEPTLEDVPHYYYDEVRKSFDDYAKLTENALEFEYANHQNDADIVVKFMPEISGGKCTGNNDCLHILGLTETDIVGSILKKTSVKLRTKDTDGTKFTANQIHNIAKHEIGHALGISGHSYHPDDVMYPVSNDAEWAENSRTLIIDRKEFSSRDRNTIKLLYQIIPDITNKRYNSKAHPNMYYPIAVLGTQQEIGERKLAESARYIKEVSSSFIAQMALAESYFVSKNPQKAKETFEQALALAVTDEEKFTVYYNLAVIEYQQKNYNDAINYANIANTYSTEQQSDEIKAYCLMETKKYAQAEKTLVKLTNKNPDNITYSATLASAYLKQYKFGKLLGELKRIKTLNPNAFAEPALAPYKFLEGIL